MSERILRLNFRVPLSSASIDTSRWAIRTLWQVTTSRRHPQSASIYIGTAHFLSTVMVSQAVAEGIFRFVRERNGRTGEDGDRPTVAGRLMGDGVISEACSTAFVQIWRSFRNDVHHMNPKVATISFPDLAKRNIDDLAIIEREVFAYEVGNGKLIPAQPLYWDLNPDGTAPVFLRMHP